MQNLFNPSVKQSFIDRINKLQPNTQALWGVMSVDQMLAHCQVPIDLAYGNLILKPNKILAFLFGKRLLKKLMADDKKFTKNSPTFNEAKIKTTAGFDVEKKDLISLIAQFNEEKIVLKMHPFFGEMSAQQWAILQFKHLDHHLSQFGV